MSKQKCSTIVLFGETNAGKSTLLNQLVGQKISIVTPKVQTTRIRITGVAIEGESQLVFVDTPGIFEPTKTLHKAMLKEAWSSIAHTDQIVVLLDCRKGLTEKVELILERLNEQNIEPIIVFNKVDKLDRQKLLPLAKEIGDKYKFKELFMISALKNDGVDGFKKYLADTAKEGSWLYPEDQISDLPQKILAAEETREKLFMNLQQELPYGVAVETEKWEEDEEKIVIHQIIYVARKNQKPMVIGKGGEMLKIVGEQARKSLEKQLEKKVNLFLHVKYKENWENDKEIYQAIGLEYPG
jgi:GTP-binding protein Era